MREMVKRKTSIVVDDRLWSEFIVFVVRKHGSAKRTSEEIEKAMREHLKKGK